MAVVKKSYTWNVTDPSIINKIKNAKPDESVDSDIFRMHGFNWHLKFFKERSEYPGNAMVFFCLANLPPTISQISGKRWISIKEFNFQYENTFSFERDDLNAGFVESTLHTSAVKNFDRLTIQCDIQILDIYDKNGNIVTDQYISVDDYKNMNDAPQSSTIDDKFKLQDIRLDSLANQVEILMKSVNEIQNSIKNIQLQKNEEQKYNNNDLKKEIYEMKKTIQSLTMNNNNNKMDKNKQEFKDWINNELKLPQYYDIFVQNGIDTLHVAQLLTANELTEIGISTIGHKMKILHEVAKLKQKLSAAYQEGHYLVDTNQ